MRVVAQTREVMGRSEATRRMRMLCEDFMGVGLWFRGWGQERW